MDTLFIHHTCCSPLCQHPYCWKSENNIEYCCPLNTQGKCSKTSNNGDKIIKDKEIIIVPIPVLDLASSFALENNYTPVKHTNCRFWKHVALMKSKSLANQSVNAIKCHKKENTVINLCMVESRVCSPSDNKHFRNQMNLEDIWILPKGKKKNKRVRKPLTNFNDASPFFKNNTKEISSNILNKFTHEASPRKIGFHKSYLKRNKHKAHYQTRNQCDEREGRFHSSASATAAGHENGFTLIQETQIRSERQTGEERTKEDSPKWQHNTTQFCYSGVTLFSFLHLVYEGNCFEYLTIHY
ncbi:Hypothetical predicted protein [Octopus vulgaris]|uniref:Uncharacterized protein n=1 Tax=Octopus vulgaris TaxID=6645 RepID=A0AA36AMK6_OCTVU|nr:Hypothetical predicted protein [Octopus vulgaris]